MPPKKYPDVATIKKHLSLASFRKEARRSANWQKLVNIIAVAGILIVALLLIWFFWPQINAVIAQIVAWRNQINQ